MAPPHTAFFYAPHNPRYRAPAGEHPPLIVFSHGGPTGATASTLDLDVQFWTSRGFGVLDVNYRGSTGYGRTYRELLHDQWGIADVEDCVAGARWLVEQGRADGKRLLIRGGSAGGYTTLMALVSTDAFAAGASYFGVSDAEALALETHKFESRYLDWLIGPYPERRDLYLERSPLTHVENLSSPTIFFQGLDDKVVLPNQAEMMVAALRKKGIPVAYIAYAGEGHGFRRAENIIHSQQAELSFYAQVLGITPADELPEIDIENLSRRVGGVG
jgi:dipeptidyl aminopeptidase/acylaminoacyl peptidase